MPEGKQSFNNSAGVPLVGGKLYTYDAGTSTPRPTYQDAAGTVPNTNPVILDARGEATVFWSGAYKAILKDASDVTIWTVDGISGVSGTDLSSSAGAGLIGFLYATVYAAGTIGKWLKDLALGAGSGFIGFVQLGLGAIVRTVLDKLREQITFEDYGADPTGATDSTAAFNAAILAAYQRAQNVLSPNGEIYTTTIKGKAGADYKLLGKVVIPSQIMLDLNGSRCIGPDAAAGSTAYSAIGSVMFATGYYDGAAIQPNATAATETTWRVVGSGIKNVTFANSNCPMDFTNMQEQSFLDGLRWSNCSCLMRLKNSFYLRVGTGLARGSALAAGQYAVLLHGVAAHDLRFDLRIVGASIGYEVTATNSFSVEIGGSLEEGYATNSIGIRNNGAYCQSWSVHAYCEGVRKGITTVNNGFFFACDFSPSYFSSTEYAVQAGVSGFRNCTFDALSAPDEGAGIRNIMDFSAFNNDAWVRMASKGRNSSLGPQGYPTNVLMGSNGGQVLSVSAWSDTVDTSRNLALCDGRQANNSTLGTFPFEGRHTVTVINQVPFWSHSSPTGATIQMDSLLTYDESTPIIGHIVVADNNGTYTFDFIMMGTTVYPLTAFTAGKTLTAVSNAGIYRFTIGGLTIIAGVYTIKGFARIM